MEAADRNRRLAWDEIGRGDAEVAYREFLGEAKRVRTQVAKMRRKLGHVAPTEVEAEVEQTMALLGEIGAILQESDRGTLRAVLSSLGAAVTIDSSPRRVGKRLDLPVSAELRLASPLVELGENGRGERI